MILNCLRRELGVNRSNVGESSPFVLGVMARVWSRYVRRHLDDLMRNELKYGAFENVALPISLHQSR